MIFGWFKSEQRERRKKVRLDRKYLEARSRRFLKSYLEADANARAQFYRAVEDISKQCKPAGLEAQTDLDDSRIAEATSEAAIKMVLEGDARVRKDDRFGNFVTDACATVAIAYRRVAGVYTVDKEMQELGTAAVHLLTTATSYTNSQKG